MFGVSEELQIILVDMGNSKEKIVLLLVASAVLFVSIIVMSCASFVYICIALAILNMPTKLMMMIICP